MNGFLHWLLDFIGVRNGENDFATHMYNFWSGFGGNVSVLAVLGAGLGVYRHHLKQVASLLSVRHRHHDGHAGGHDEVVEDGTVEDGTEQPDR